LTNEKVEKPKKKSANAGVIAPIEILKKPIEKPAPVETLGIFGEGFQPPGLHWAPADGSLFLSLSGCYERRGQIWFPISFNDAKTKLNYCQGSGSMLFFNVSSQLIAGIKEKAIKQSLAQSCSESWGTAISNLTTKPKTFFDPLDDDT
jgi:hypothetical protein